MKQVRNRIKAWFKEFKRDLPWRKTHDPYLIWLSEVILQQTRIQQGLPYYARFVSRYPSVFDLAEANEEEVLNLWQGLGYYNRARNLHETAKIIANEYNGKFPADYSELKRLKGIGDYTASAISSMAFNQPYAVVDGNVNRVISRIFGIKEAVNTNEGKNQIKEIAQELLDLSDPGSFNEALMDFGATQCTSGNPKCGICPLQENCLAFHENMVNDLPVKYKKLTRKTRYFNYVVLYNKKGIVLKQRDANDIWSKMYDFPLLEGKESLNGEQGEFLQSLGVDPNDLEYLRQYKHVLSHQNIIANFYLATNFDLNKILNNFIFVEWGKFESYPLPRLIDRFCSENLDFN